MELVRKVLRGNYFSLLLFLSVLTGAITGIYMGKDARVLAPAGEIFINLIFCLVVPLVFFSIASSIASMREPARLGRILCQGFIFFTLMSLMAAFLGIAGMILFNPAEGEELSPYRKIFYEEKDKKISSSEAEESSGLVARFARALTVDDFVHLLSRKNMLPLLLFAILTGLGTAMSGKNGLYFLNFLRAGASVTSKMVEIVFYYAPVGLCCYFAAVVGELGPSIMGIYFRIFILYLGFAIFYVILLLPFYVFLAGGRESLKAFILNSPGPALTALATCSSAASIPANLQAAKRMGISADVAEILIPLGASLHKDGSVMGGVIKIIFLLTLAGQDFYSFSSLAAIALVAIVTGAVMGAVPGGGMIGEMFILSIYGSGPGALPFLAVISTIIDAPATMLNVLGDLPLALWASKKTDRSYGVLPHFQEAEGVPASVKSAVSCESGKYSPETGIRNHSGIPA